MLQVIVCPIGEKRDFVPTDFGYRWFRLGRCWYSGTSGGRRSVEVHSGGHSVGILVIFWLKNFFFEFFQEKVVLVYFFSRSCLLEF